MKVERSAHHDYDSFSFYEESKKQKQVVANRLAWKYLQNIEAALLKQQIGQMAYENHPSEAEALQEAPSRSFYLNYSIVRDYPSAVSTSCTLYEVLVYGLLVRLYGGSIVEEPPGYRIANTYKTKPLLKTKLLELKTIIYTDELEDLTIGVEALPYRFSSVFSNQQLKVLIAQSFTSIEYLISEGLEAYQAVLSTLNRQPIFLFAQTLMLRKLVKRLSNLYEMELEHESIYDLGNDPELDILWLLCEFFDMSVLMYQIDSKVIKEQKFKVADGSFLVLARNAELSSKSNWTYLLLRYTPLHDISYIQPEYMKNIQEPFWKASSSASDIKLITNFERVAEVPLIKTARKVPKISKVKRSVKLKEYFGYEFKAMVAQTEYVLGRAESLLVKLSRVVSQPKQDMKIEHTVAVQIGKGKSNT